MHVSGKQNPDKTMTILCGIQGGNKLSKEWAGSRHLNAWATVDCTTSNESWLAVMQVQVQPAEAAVIGCGRTKA